MLTVVVGSPLSGTDMPIWIIESSKWVMPCFDDSIMAKNVTKCYAPKKR